jgi:hypothetical protein
MAVRQAQRPFRAHKVPAHRRTRSGSHATDAGADSRGWTLGRMPRDRKKAGDISQSGGPAEFVID